MDPKERRKVAFDFFAKDDMVVNPDNLYKPRDGDIIVVGPMKTGTTWLQQILHQMRSKGDESFRDIYDVTWVMVNPLRQWDFNLNAEQVFNPRIYKCHENYAVINTTDKQKIVVINRDPYDTAFSMTKFFGGFYGDDDMTEEETIAAMMLFQEKNTCASFSCMSTWWAHRNDPNVLFLFYEDLKHDLGKMIRKISEFVDIPLTEEELQIVCYFSSFEYMAKHKEKFQGESIVDAISQFTGMEKWKPKVGMIRTDGGKVGEGITNLAPKLRSTIDQLWKNTIEQQYGLKSYQEMYDQHGIFSKNKKA